MYVCICIYIYIGYDLPGDLILVVSLSPHFLFRRDGNDILHTVEITLQQALTIYIQQRPTYTYKKRPTYTYNRGLLS